MLVTREHNIQEQYLNKMYFLVSADQQCIEKLEY